MGLTLGDVAGVGPELALHALATPARWRPARLVIYGSATLLEEVAAASGLPWPGCAGVRLVTAGSEWEASEEDQRPVLVDTTPDEPIVPGQIAAVCGRLAYDWVAAATADALRGRIDGVVTAPLSKAALQAAGIDFPGHTEMLASLTGSREPRMFFWSPGLAVGLVTIHVALAEVTPLITEAAVLATIRQVHGAISTPKRPQPRIAVLGLNPHAGEGGLFGRSESEAITPAVAAAQAGGIEAFGPLVPDVAFREPMRREVDAYVAMYHDQGLIPFKMLAFDEGVNVTLGLPFCRTSPDHGTAFDIAWQGRVRPDSLFAAFDYARRHTRRGES